MRRDRAGSGISRQFLLVPGPLWARGEPGADRAWPRVLWGGEGCCCLLEGCDLRGELEAGPKLWDRLPGPGDTARGR